MDGYYLQLQHDLLQKQAKKDEKVIVVKAKTKSGIHIRFNKIVKKEKNGKTN